MRGAGHIPPVGHILGPEASCDLGKRVEVVDRGPHTLQPYRMISAAAILVTNVHGDEPEHTIVVI